MIGKTVLFIGLVGTAIICGEGSPARAGLIDFESQRTGLVPGEALVLISDGIEVTFTGPGLHIRQFGAPDFPDTKVLSTTDDTRPITVTFETGFTAPFVEMENILNGRYAEEMDLIIGTAFDVDNNVLDMQTNSNTIHHLDGPGIAMVVYDDVRGENTQGFLMDNFYFVPEPMSLSLLALGGLLVIRRRR